MREWCFFLLLGQFGHFSSSSHFVLSLYEEKNLKTTRVNYQYLTRNTILASRTNIINHSDHATLLFKHIEYVNGALQSCWVSQASFLQAHILYCVCTGTLGAAKFQKKKEMFTIGTFQEIRYQHLELTSSTILSILTCF